MAGLVDLHAHTVVSDGTVAPAQLVRLAKAKGLVALAVTDHDHVGGIEEAMEEGRRIGVEVVPGIELSVEDPECGELHVLGYLFDPEDPALLNKLELLRNARLSRGARIVERLRQHGLDVTLQDVAREARSDEGASLGRPHVARVLMAKGYVASVQEAFDKWLGEGRRGYVPKDRLAPQDALLLVHNAGGVAVLAHAVTVDASKRAALVRKLAAMGLDGVEVQHSKHGEAERRELQALADELGLVATGGSDFHGENKPGVELGTGREGNVRTTREVLDALKTRAAKRRSPTARGS